MRALFVGLSVCLLGAAVYGVGLLIELRAATAPPSPEAFVQAAWSVYRFAPGHRQHVGQLSLDCKACHQTQAGKSFDRPGPAACVACHEEHSTIQHAMVSVDLKGQRVDAGAGEQRVTDCIACHGFGPDPDEQASDCLSCHAQARGHVPKIATHADVACQECHEVHENRVAPMRCTECHSIRAEHGHASTSPEQTCLTCHRAHDRAAPALEGCRECHGGQAGAGRSAQVAAPVSVPETASFEGHTCTGCHAPHGFAKERVTPCATCHAQVHVLEGKGHGACSACHEPHRARESVAKNVCVGCHADVALSHSPTIDAREACTTCHVAHPGSAREGGVHGREASCAACHTDVGKGGEHAHAGDMRCTSCHQPHAFALPEGQQACTRCHAEQASLVQTNAGHARCAGCHQALPHGGELTAKACTGCHSEVHAQRTHRVCTNCHEPHQGAWNKRACADCHAAEARVGIHAARLLRCTQCHDQHTTKLAPGVADCTACHTRSRLPGLHAVAQHASACTSCHAPHDADLPGARETCLSCHQDRKGHQPAAKRCEGCHQFVSAPAALGNKP